MDQCSTDELYEAFAVLAGSDPENCSYLKGYVKRQAVFVCHTCVRSDTDPAGVCLACANTCHDGHDITELYTKRNFRCDCGNEKFGGNQCKLFPVKEARNPKNLYNHNYSGRFCGCDRPYPHEDDQVDEEMIQCVVCEDWYHTKHLESPVEEAEELMEMICGSCMNHAPFLWTYANYCAMSAQKKPEENCCVTPASSAGRCVLRQMEEVKVRGQGAVFWPCDWRSRLCPCSSCKRMYLESGVSFLLDGSDTLLAYEERARAECVTGEELLLSCISSLDHVQRLEIIYQFKDLKDKLQEFLQLSASQEKDVTPEMFQAFLQDLQNRQRSSD